jgi:hypothetical protein
MKQTHTSAPLPPTLPRTLAAPIQTRASIQQPVRMTPLSRRPAVVFGLEPGTVRRRRESLGYYERMNLGAMGSSQRRFPVDRSAERTQLIEQYDSTEAYYADFERRDREQFASKYRLGDN